MLTDIWTDIQTDFQTDISIDHGAALALALDLELRLARFVIQLHPPHPGENYLLEFKNPWREAGAPNLLDD